MILVRVSRSRRRYLWNKRRRLMQKRDAAWPNPVDEIQAKIDLLSDTLEAMYETRDEFYSHNQW